MQRRKYIFGLWAYKDRYPPETEATHIFTADNIVMYESRNVEEVSRGNGLDAIMQEAIWRVKI